MRAEQQHLSESAQVDEQSIQPFLTVFDQQVAALSANASV